MANPKWYILINPISGNGKGISVWNLLKEKLHKANIVFEFGISEYHKHGIELAHKASNSGYRRFLAVGGDGTLNETLNGIAMSNLSQLGEHTLTVLPVGTGNDWVRYHKITGNIDAIISRLISGNTSVHDIGKIILNNANKTRYFINVGGAGLDGVVVSQLENISGSKKKWDYIKSMILSLVKYNAPHAQITIDNEKKYNERLLLLTAGICPWFGGGMHISPNAVHDDGFLDMSLVKKVNNLQLFPQLYKLFNGRINEMSFVEQKPVKSIKIVADTPIIAEADGELAGIDSSIEIELCQQQIYVII